MNAEFVLKKEIGIEIINGKEYTRVEKHHFYSPWECEKKFNSLNDNAFVILMRKGIKWCVISLEELMKLSEKIKKRMAASVKQPRVSKIKDRRLRKLEHYETCPTERKNFKSYCTRHNLNFEDFEEIEVPRKSYETIKFVYKLKERN